MTNWKAKLKALGPCPEAYKWACQYNTLRQAWRACEDADDMLWLLEECDYDATREIYNVLSEVRAWGGRDPFEEEVLRDAYMILDFMPEPPTLPAELP